MHTALLFIPLHHQRRYRAHSVDGKVCWIQNWGARHLLAGAWRPAQGQQHPQHWPQRRLHGPSGSLGFPGPCPADSEVLALVLASASRLHTDSFEVARWTGSDSRLRTACKLRLDTEVTECSEGGPSHSWPTTGTEIVIVAISRTCCRAAVPCEFWVRLPG